MDIFRRILGIPNKRDTFEDVIQDRGHPYAGPPGAPDNQHTDDFYENHDQFSAPEHNLFAQLDQEFQEMEKQFKDIWSMFGMGPSFFSDPGVYFRGFNDIPHSPESRDQVPCLPPMDPSGSEDSLRHNMLKPSLQQPQYKREDTDLDNMVQENGLSSIFGDNKIYQDPQKPFQSPGLRVFGSSVSVRTITKPDGSMETRRVVRDSEGNEHVTVTQIPAPEGFKTSPGPQLRPINPPGHREMDFFEKLFGRRS